MLLNGQVETYKFKPVTPELNLNIFIYWSSILHFIT